MNDWLTLIVIYAALFISSPLIVILHELGHALGYLILTKADKVDIYIGSYGVKNKTIQFNIGKLHFYIKRSFPFIKGIGLCSSHKPESNYLNYIIILLAGPLFTVFAAGIMVAIVFTADAQLLLKISCYIFLGLSLVSLIGNLVPRVINTIEGINLNTDGKQILSTIKLKTMLPDYIEARQFVREKDYETALSKLKSILEIVPDSEEILRLIIISALSAKQYGVASLYFEKLESKFKLSNNDLINKGYLYSAKKEHHAAILAYNKALKSNRNNIIALNNMGYELIEQRSYKIAQQALEKAIKIKPEFDHPYGNLGYLKILQGDLQAGKQFIDTCLKLNNENASAYKYLGIYYLKMRKAELAKENFDKAMGIDNSLEIEEYADELALLTN